jgi:sulfide:quinone oxidoreductase
VPAKFKPTQPVSNVVDVLIVGGGAAGAATAASLRRRNKRLDVAILEPSETHYYQPAWTLVGGGAFRADRTVRPMASCIPAGVRWLRGAAAEFRPDQNEVLTTDGETLRYRVLVVATGLVLDWDQIPGLKETLGHNGVTSNYRFDLAPNTWRQVQALKRGRALFTQPAMPIKCAGAPQKAMYLSCDHWRRVDVLGDLAVEFHAAGPVLFGVPEFVGPLNRYIERYGVQTHFQSTLKAVDGPRRRATFEVRSGDSPPRLEERSFDLLHVVPPQRSPEVVRASPLADAAGWVDVDPATLQHPRYRDVFAVGDVAGTSNAKTAAAVRKQAPVVARNILAHLEGSPLPVAYDGYGSCPLTVERGKVILAEFGYGGRLMPSFPWDPTRSRRSAWVLKAKLLPWIYFDLMLKGREWLAKPRPVAA